MSRSRSSLPCSRWTRRAVLLLAVEPARDDAQQGMAAHTGVGVPGPSEDGLLGAALSELLGHAPHGPAAPFVLGTKVFSNNRDGGFEVAGAGLATGDVVIDELAVADELGSHKRARNIAVHGL